MAPEKTLPYQEQADLFRLLIHPVRLAILSILRDGEHCVCHMEAHLGLRQAYLSQQLSVLRQAGLIQDRRDGWNIYYQVTDRRVYAILDAASTMVGSDAAGNQFLDAVSCPCPQCSQKG